MRTKQNALIKSEVLIVATIELEKNLSLLRKQYAKQFGELKGLNKYPISGGICEHWADFAKEAILELVHLKQELEDESLSLWRESGRRSHTWRAYKEKISIETA